MAEWHVEHGIGERRAVRIADGEIVEARILLDGVARAGARLAARLLTVRPRAVAEAEGQEYLLPKGAPGVAEGGAVVIEVTREAIPGGEPWKRPLARITSDTVGDEAEMDAKPLPFPAPDDLLGRAGWDDLLDEARSGIVRFAGGELRLSATPAMTLIDVDGYLPSAELALAGTQAAARAILRHDIGGSIGFDLPTVAGKDVRTRIGAAVDAILPRPFERTAVNGFGFLQIVRPRVRASLLELAADAARFEARALLRRAARGHGPQRLVAHPAVIARLEAHPHWLEQLGRQAGGTVTLRSTPALAMCGAYAEPA